MENEKSRVGTMRNWCDPVMTGLGDERKSSGWIYDVGDISGSEVPRDRYSPTNAPREEKWGGEKYAEVDAKEEIIKEMKKKKCERDKSAGKNGPPSPCDNNTR